MLYYHKVKVANGTKPHFSKYKEIMTSPKICICDIFEYFTPLQETFGTYTYNIIIILY